MPTFDYRCTACGRVFEVLHGVHANGPERCEVCGGALSKLISAPTIHFKGSGWAGKDARDSVRSRSTSSTTSEPKPETEGKKAAGDDAAPSSAKPDTSKTETSKPETAKASTDKAAASAGPAKPAA